MGFTRWPLTFRSQQDGVVINCRSLRARTLFGPHFKRALRLCLLAGSGVADRPGYGPIASSFPHIWRAAPWRKMRLCVSWCFHMTSLLALQPIRTPPSYFCCLFPLSSRGLMRNSRGVFPITPSAAMLLSRTKLRQVCFKREKYRASACLHYQPRRVWNQDHEIPTCEFYCIAQERRSSWSSAPSQTPSVDLYVDRRRPWQRDRADCGAQQVRSWIAEPEKIHKLPQRLNRTLAWLC